MNRRDFLKYGALTLSPLLIKVAQEATASSPAHNFEIELLSDAAVGHILRESQQYPKGKTLKTNYLIVGGGIAGLSAAYALRKEDFLLCELSQQLGGSSSANTHRDQYFAQGAHYDLAYPAYYGKELLGVLYDLDVVDYNSQLDTWEFVDRQYLIAPDKESVTFDKGTIRADMLPEGEEKDKLKALLLPFVGHMPMPTTQIDPQFHYLNKLTFAQYLQQKGITNPALLQAIDYAMRDDWGASSQVVSALAGVHYYTCRPYFEQDPQLFSPPQGNAYFAQKFISKVPQKRLLTQQLVQKIQPTSTGFEVTIVDVKAKQQWTIQTQKIVYAAHKHALKYVYPKGYTLFENNQYSPWVVVNVILKNPPTKKMIWQNEYLSGEETFMGFVDSGAQFQPQTTRRTLTAYYCFAPEERGQLLQLSQKAPALVQKTIGYLEEVLKEELKPQIEKVYLKAMGHAMPIPHPHFLLQNPNQNALNTGIAYAGVDSGRLPLFFEAADSGLQAVKALQSSS